MSGRLRDAVTEVRHIVEGLGPLSLDELGLAGAIERFGSADGDSPHVSVEVDRPLPALPAAVEVAAYRIAAEAVTNAVRHADAAVIQVAVRLRDGSVEVAARDDGRGFGAEVIAGLGLQSMHERAEEVGGRLELDSMTAGGTSVVARLPVEAT
jgi:signal transduction histidine kinase